MLNAINQFATDYAPTVNALAAVATSAAAIIALYATWLVRQERKVRLHGEVEVNSIFEHRADSIGEEGTYKFDRTSISVTLKNVGMRGTKIPWVAFGLAAPGAKGGVLLQPITDYRSKAPLDHPIGDAVVLELTTPEKLREVLLDYPSGFLPRWRIERARFTFQDLEGTVFRLRRGKNLRAELKKIGREVPFWWRSTKYR